MNAIVERVSPPPDDLPESVSSLYAESLPAPRTGALFNAFSYPTKIAPESIALFIATHTLPGDTVVDVFAGSGTTGLAAKLCDKPTPTMIESAKQMGITPIWGPRKAVLYDVSVLGSFIGASMCAPPSPTRFEAAARELLSLAEKTYGWLYRTTGPDGEPAVIRHIIWSEILLCPSCSAMSTYWDAAVRHDPLRLKTTYDCDECGTVNEIDECKRALEAVYDPLIGQVVERRCRVPVQVYGTSAGRKWQRAATEGDLVGSERAVATEIPASAPRVSIAWGDLYRAGYHRGITHLHHFYTPRNFLAVSVLWDLVKHFDEDLRDSLRLLILSYNAAHSTLMTRVVLKQNQKDLVLTGAQTGVLYVSGLPVEKNVFEGVRRKVKTFVEAFTLVHGSGSSVEVVNKSSTKIDLPDKSVSYVFTDPPFADYIPYAEVNEINEAWLGRTTDRRAEIVVSSSGGKDISVYGDLMSKVFGEVSRVIRDDGLATVVFHSAKAAVWQALTRAFSEAGLRVRTASVLAKTQASFKQVVSTTTVKGDPLILLTKGDGKSRSSGLTSVEEVVEAVLSDAADSAAEDERTRERLFSRFITRCLVEGIPVTIGAAEFYALARLHPAA